MGYDKEVDMIARHAAWICSPAPMSTTPRKPGRWPSAGADILVPHVGLTTKGMIGAKSAMSLATAAERVQAMADAAFAVRR